MTQNTFSLISFNKDKKNIKRKSDEIFTSAKVYYNSLEDYKIAVDSDNIPPYDWSVLFLHKLAAIEKQDEPHKIGTLFTFKTIKREYKCSAFPLSNKICKDTKLFDSFFTSLQGQGSKYINKFTFPIEESVSKELFKIIFSEIEQWSNQEVKKISDTLSFKEEQSAKGSQECYISINSKTKVSLKNWQDIYSSRSILKEGTGNKLGEFGFGGYPAVLIAENDRFICMATIHPNNQHFIDDRVLPIENNLTVSFCLFEACKSQTKLIPFYKNISSVFNMYTQFIYGQDLNKNIESSIGEASEIARYWYTDGLQELNKKQDEFDQASNSFLFSKSFIDEILVKDIPGVNNIEIYPFDRIFIFKQSTLDKEEQNIEMHVAEALLKQKSKSEDPLIRDRDGFVYEWERYQQIADYDIDFNKKIIDYQQFIIDIDEKHGTKKFTLSAKETGEGIVDLEMKPPEDGEQSIESVIDEMLYNVLTADVEKKKLLEYEGEYFKDGLCYIYSQGLLLSDLPQFEALIKAYWESLSKLDIKYDNIKDFSKKILKDLDDTKIVLVSYKPDKSDKDGNKDAFTMIIIADKDIAKTQSELSAEKDDLHTAYKLMVRQQTETAELNREMREKSKSIVLDQLGQAVHNIKGKVTQGIQKLIEKIDLDMTKMDEVYVYRDDILKDIDLIKEKFSTDINDSTAVLEYINIESESSTLNTVKIFISLIENHVYDLINPNAAYDKIAKKIISLTEEKNVIYAEKIQTIDNEFIFNFNNFGLPSLIMPNHNLIREAFHTLLKNSTEAVLSANQEKKYISITSSVLHLKNEKGILNIEIINSTNPLSKARLNEINDPELDHVSIGEKVGSTGSGVAKSRQQLQKIFGDEINIFYSMLDKYTILCRFSIPIKFIESNNLYEASIVSSPVKVAEASKSAKVFYLEDDKVNYEKTLNYFKTLSLSYKHSTSLENFIKQFTNEKILLTDLNILGKPSSASTITSGYQAIKYFLTKQPKGIVVIISTVSPKDIRNELVKSKYKLDSIQLHDTLENDMQEGHVYIYNRHKIITAKTISEPLKKLLGIESQQEAVQSSQTYIGQNISDILASTDQKISKVYLHNDITHTTLSKKKLLQSSVNLWIRHERKTDLGFLEPISNPDEFQTVLVIPVKVKDIESLNPFLLNYFGMKNNIHFIVFLEGIKSDLVQNTIQKTLLLREKMKLKSNGLFSAIRHDINKIDSDELVQKLLELINTVDEISKKDFEEILETNNDDMQEILDDTYREYENVINDVKVKGIALGGVGIENHEELLETLSLLIELNNAVVLGNSDA
jgi:hypothetical protein